MENVMYVGYMETLQGNVLHSILFKKTNLCNKPTWRGESIIKYTEKVIISKAAKKWSNF
jgi:hypothetical protein